MKYILLSTVFIFATLFVMAQANQLTGKPSAWTYRFQGDEITRSLNSIEGQTKGLKHLEIKKANW